MPHKTSTSARASIQSLASNGGLGPASANLLSSHDRIVPIADISMTFAPPVFSCILIDASPSMDECREAVIQGQNAILEAWRGGSNCRKSALFVAQYLFSDSAELLCPFEKLDVNGNDQVTLLTEFNYNPKKGDGTALYKAVFQNLQDMAANIESSLNDNAILTFTVMLITDGVDNRGGIRPADIKIIIQDLRSKGHMTQSTVIGITHPKFTQSMVNNIKEELGFDEAIFCSLDPQAIRRACDQASSSAMQSRRPA